MLPAQLATLRHVPHHHDIGVGGVQAKVKVWNMRTMTHVRTLSGHQGGCFGLALLPGGRFASGGGTDKVRPRRTSHAAGSWLAGVLQQWLAASSFVCRH